MSGTLVTALIALALANSAQAVNHWRATQYGEECSASCGGGVYQRKVRCTNLQGKAMPESMCPTPRPVTAKPCNKVACPPAISRVPHGKCVQCQQVQKLECRRLEANGTTTRLALSLCGVTAGLEMAVCARLADCGAEWQLPPALGCCAGSLTANATCSAAGAPLQDKICEHYKLQRPDAIACRGQCPTQTPTTEPSVGSQWRLENKFSPCSVTCGGGNRTRAVRCTDHYGKTIGDRFCAAQPRPHGVESCAYVKCPPYLVNLTGWSPCQRCQHARQVECRQADVEGHERTVAMDHCDRKDGLEHRLCARPLCRAQWLPGQVDCCDRLRLAVQPRCAELGTVIDDAVCAHWSLVKPPPLPCTARVTCTEAPPTVSSTPIIKDARPVLPGQQDKHRGNKVDVFPTPPGQQPAGRTSPQQPTLYPGQGQTHPAGMNGVHPGPAVTPGPARGPYAGPYPNPRTGGRPVNYPFASYTTSTQAPGPVSVSNPPIRKPVNGTGPAVKTGPGYVRPGGPHYPPGVSTPPGSRGGYHIPPGPRPGPGQGGVPQGGPAHPLPQYPTLPSGGQPGGPGVPPGPGHPYPGGVPQAGPANPLPQYPGMPSGQQPGGPGQPDLGGVPQAGPANPFPQYPGMPSGNQPGGPGQPYPGGVPQAGPANPFPQYPAMPSGNQPGGPGQPYPGGVPQAGPANPFQQYPAMPSGPQPGRPGMNPGPGAGTPHKAGPHYPKYLPRPPQDVDTIQRFFPDLYDRQYPTLAQPAWNDTTNATDTDFADENSTSTDVFTPTMDINVIGADTSVYGSSIRGGHGQSSACGRCCTAPVAMVFTLTALAVLTDSLVSALVMLKVY